MFGFEDLKYLFMNQNIETKDIYRQDLQKNKRIVDEINIYNKDFSQSLFLSWVSNVLLRYILLCSKNEDMDKLASFEKIHLSEHTKPYWHETINIYNNYKDINVKFVDYIDYTHTDSEDYLLLKVCLLCTLKNDSVVEEIKQLFYDIKLKKQNVKSDDLNNDNFTSNCPNCGAPTNISTFGICSHCQELISIYDNIWKIISISIDE